MDGLFILNRLSLDDAADLIDRFGPEAAFVAATRASASREADNVIRFCHWRQIERMIVALASDEVQGTVH